MAADETVPKFLLESYPEIRWLPRYLLIRRRLQLLLAISAPTAIFLPLFFLKVLAAAVFLASLLALDICDRAFFTRLAKSANEAFEQNRIDPVEFERWKKFADSKGWGTLFRH